MGHSLWQTINIGIGALVIVFFDGITISVIANISDIGPPGNQLVFDKIIPFFIILTS